ncbi:hypothetical protein WP8S18E04_28120 [Aeromonas caviae]|uniref:DUF4435 domain-containing protein n=1 Tax=Aeromonas caviae TaxID=648 RepID=UPI0015DC3AA0|nr:DUF4435 domain-containing protein [Aeromonas caviae]MBL0654222.1 DUF4435 domain-containing protein [Aeromonas caviae]BBT67428.1 hypothetical protein WP8S18E04_28120 [Aeromonas caviae]
MLIRSTAARLAVSKFYEDFNDIDVFIEDTALGYTKIFSILLSRTLSKNISLEKVFPLGGRGRVIDAAKNALKAKANRSAIYIVDGDLYLLCGEPDKLPDNVISLNKYCIENYLLDNDAISQVFYEETAEKSLEQINNEISLDRWIKDNVTALKKLFIWFAVSHKLKSGIPTVSIGYAKVCEQGNISLAKVDAICENINIQLMTQHDEYIITKTYNEVSDSINNDVCFVKHYVSAKDFLLPLFFIKARTITGSKATNLSLKLRLAGLCDTADISKLINTISIITNRTDLLPDAS